MRVAVLRRHHRRAGRAVAIPGQELPAGYEVTGGDRSNARFDGNTESGHVLTLKVNAPGQRSHQFLISMERSLTEANADAPFLSFKAAQRETGEVLVEGAGTMEITATEGGGLKPDGCEGGESLFCARWRTSRLRRHSAITGSRARLQRWHSNWVRFPDGSVLGAVAETAEVTTLVTSEGKSQRDRSEAHVEKIRRTALPESCAARGRSRFCSADVAGRARQAGARTGWQPGAAVAVRGFRPTDTYTVSFVFVHSGATVCKERWRGAEPSNHGHSYQHADTWEDVPAGAL